MGKFRSGFVAVVGRPNVGKSTLLNALIGQKIAIVSDKPQTTRNTIQCVLTTAEAQIVFLDTPGIHKPLHKLGEYMVESALSALNEVDAVLWLVEMGNWTKADEHILRELQPVTPPIVLVANKADLVPAERRAEFMELAAGKRQFAELVAVSALTGENLKALVDLLIGFLPEGPKYYPDDWITDHPERFVFAEFIREEILKLTEEEVPHSVAVDVDEVKEDPQKNLVRIRATIYVERDSQKGIIIGKQGSMLKAIGTGARKQIEGLLGVQVFLDLWVKVKKDWRNKPGALQEFGYK
ncbi:MAG TPA: GTPase Era [Firmicutes bacterium]|jgi:GTP-binding protein Era|nr:MAG: GTPase Era [Peptococcaceae bacterium 1109]HHT73121.1 GTPase Era [Bacillota bacterium]